MTMPWGKYRGEPIDAVPSSYLAWLVEDAERVPHALLAAARAELADRFGGTEVIMQEARPALPVKLRPVARELIDAGVRSCARRRHPDVGGSHEAMLELQDAADALRKLW